MDAAAPDTGAFLKGTGAVLRHVLNVRARARDSLTALCFAKAVTFLRTVDVAENLLETEETMRAIKFFAVRNGDEPWQNDAFAGVTPTSVCECVCAVAKCVGELLPRDGGGEAPDLQTRQYLAQITHAACVILRCLDALRSRLETEVVATVAAFVDTHAALGHTVPEIARDEALLRLTRYCATARFAAPYKKAFKTARPPFSRDAVAVFRHLGLLAPTAAGAGADRESIEDRAGNKSQKRYMSSLLLVALKIDEGEVCGLSTEALAAAPYVGCLPCDHVFSAPALDAFLATRKVHCPMCKAKFKEY